jgi:hypothetical protein
MAFKPADDLLVNIKRTFCSSTENQGLGPENVFEIAICCDWIVVTER